MRNKTPRRLQRAIEYYSHMAARGFDADEASELRRIALTLHRWAEQECNGEIEREGDNGEGRPFRSFAAWGGKHLAYPVPDRERGALRRLERLMHRHPEYLAYHQGDPRGCALYLVPRAALGDRPIDSWYNSCGFAVGY